MTGARATLTAEQFPRTNGFYQLDNLGLVHVPLTAAVQDIVDEGQQQL